MTATSASDVVAGVIGWASSATGDIGRKMKSVVVEITGHFCNARCVWCFNQYKIAEQIKPGFLSLENFKKFVLLNRGTNLRIIPFGHGEPLINPEFVDIIKHAISENVCVLHIHTNLAMDLTKEHFEVLCSLKKIVVNFGGGTNETHYMNMKTDLKKVLLNLRQLWETRERLRSKVLIVGKMVINRGNKNEVGLLNKRLNEALPIKIELRTYPLYFGCSDSDNDDKLKFIEENLEPGVPCRDNWRIENGKAIVKTKATKCYGLIPTVRWDGAVNICCRARYHDGIVGDAFKQPMSRIIGSPAYRKATERAKRREYVDYCKYCS